MAWLPLIRESCPPVRGDDALKKNLFGGGLNWNSDRRPKLTENQHRAFMKALIPFEEDGSKSIIQSFQECQVVAQFIIGDEFIMTNVGRSLLDWILGNQDDLFGVSMRDPQFVKHVGVPPAAIRNQDIGIPNVLVDFVQNWDNDRPRDEVVRQWFDAAAFSQPAPWSNRHDRAEHSGPPWLQEHRSGV
jgi:hypothetical protein